MTDVLSEWSDYRIEGNTLNGWNVFDRTSDDKMAYVFLDQWKKARPILDFRLVKVTTTITREVISGTKEVMPDAEPV